MTTLNDTQVSLIKDIANRDPAFRAVLQQRLQSELASAEARATELKEAIGGTVVEPTAPPAPVAQVRVNKAAILREVLAAHPGSTVSELAELLTKRNVSMEDGMLNSYLYNMRKSGEISKKGKRAHYTYSLTK